MSDDKSSEDLPAGDPLSDEEIRDAEAHRGFVREMDRFLGKAYGTGGAVVIAVLMSVPFIGWLMGWLTYMTLWVPGITATLLALYLVRRWIYGQRDRLRQRVEKYCEANEISVKTLKNYYEAQDMYPFFGAIFQTTPRELSDDRRAVEQ